MNYTTDDVHKKVKKLLYGLTGITLADNKDIMISNRIDKLKRDSRYKGDIMELLRSIEEGSYVTEFINSFNTNKTHFFREDFHFLDLKNRALLELAKSGNKINMYCSASSTGEEPYSMAMTVLETEKQILLSTTIREQIKIDVGITPESEHKVKKSEIKRMNSNIKSIEKEISMIKKKSEEKYNRKFSSFVNYSFTSSRILCGG